MTTKNKFAYKPLDNAYYEISYPPYFLFIPDKRDLQVMIKSATSKNEDDIVINNLSSLI